VLNHAAAEGIDAAALAVTVGFAVIRPRGWSEAFAALPCAGLVLAVGGVSAGHALVEVDRLGPVVGFLCAVLALAYLCDREGLFAAAGGALAARVGRPARLLTGVFVLASVTTAVLSLDTTVVLLTPVVLLTARRIGFAERPHLYACTHLANTASLLLPVSNLTNLLAYAAVGVSFGRFAALMVLPWLAAIAVEYLLFRWFFAADLSGATARPATAAPRLPRVASLVVAATLGGFALTSVFGVAPAWAAFAGAVVLAGRAAARGRADWAALLRATAIPFAVFVLCLGVIVRGLADNGLGPALRHVLPAGSSLPALLAVAGLAALLANLVNNLPAVLILLPVAAGAGVGPVLAVLVGVNLGPNLTYLGSLATLLWRRVLTERGVAVSVREFTRLGLLTVPVGGAVAVVCLWGALRVVGP
jgi:arsenical pump membrane protein